MVFEWIKDKRPKQKFIKKREDGDFLVVCSANMEICYLNSTAGFVLNMCNGVNTVQNIIERLSEEYDVTKIELQNDLIDIIRDLQWKKIIHLEG